MGRCRNIKPGFFENEHLATLPPLTRLLFIGLWTLADRDGRLEDRPIKIKMQLFAVDDIDVDAALQELADAGEPFIRRYTAAGVAVIEIVNWSAHQKPHNQEKSSGLPAPPDAGLPENADSQSHQGANGNRTKARSEIAPRCDSESHLGAKREREVRGNPERGNPERGNQDEETRNQDSEIPASAQRSFANDDREIAPSQKQAVTPETVFNAFLASGATKKPQKLSSGRRRKLQIRLQEPDWPWREAIAKLPIPNDAKFDWQPDFDWLIENDVNARKLAEGKYDRSAVSVRTASNLAAVEAFAHGS